ncbi:ESPR domain-containing protein, partial [Buttiauxella noackiae]|uniref:ESPR domain-containing protein n=1 Tax=Buttiauxella noackiae TaxID=82992 RepID=UPI002357E873
MNKIYRVIWNSTLGQWIVTSELGRGKIKRATRKAMLGLALGATSISPSTASECDIDTFTCELDSEWSISGNNMGVGSVDLNDGNVWVVNGPDNVSASGSSQKSIGSINQAINEGYITNSYISADVTYVNLGNKNKTVVIYDEITKSNKTVTIYDSANFVTKKTESSTGFIVGVKDPNVYISSRFATISNGSNAEVNLNSIRLSGGMRDTQFVFVDGTHEGKSSANVSGDVNINFAFEPNYDQSSTQTLNLTQTKYNGAFSTFNGATFTVNSISDLQDYNNWLVSKLISGDLNYINYVSELNKAYITTPYLGEEGVYVVNRLPQNAEPLPPAGITALLHATGKNALVTLSSTGNVKGSAGDVYRNSVFSLHDGATGVNNGVTNVIYSTAYVDTGALFVNNNSITNGAINGSGITAASVNVSNLGTSFVNNGNLNVVPQSWTSNPVGNGRVIGALATDNALITNNGHINVGVSEPALGRNSSGNMVGISLTNSSGVNSTSGKINMGYSLDGSDIYVKAGSAALYAFGKSNFSNNGVITLGAMVDGSYGIHADRTSTGSSIVNNGEITILANGGEGSFIPQESAGIYATLNSRGVYNLGEVNISGVNSVGLKSLSGSVISSSGTVNVNNGSDYSTGLRNYGAWSEGLNSLIDISGEINLRGDRAIGVHARDQGTIGLSGVGQVNFSNGENQIGYYIYGPGSKINNTSSGVQDVTTNNSTLMRLDGGATFTGATGATSTMSASGNNSTVIVATGTGTSINSGGMTLNVNGQDATGVLVEGGATGTITSTAGINLSGAGAVAGIADGQGHDLTGAATTMTDAQKKATTLTAAASLLSSLDEVTGYIARNLATLNNTGNINFSGDNATGIQVAEGATGSNSGNIVLGGAGSVGLEATASTTATKLSSTGSLSMNGDWDGSDVATRATGVLAQGNKVDVTVGDGTTTAFMNLHGAGSVGVHAKAGSNVLVKDKVQVNFDGNKSDQVAFWADGAGSTILTGSATPTGVFGDGATMFYVTDTATMAGDVKVNLTGKAGSSKTTSGVRVSDAGSQATLGANSDLTIGTNATGVLAENGGKAVIAQGAKIATGGDSAIVGKATDSSSLIENHASITSMAGSTGSTGFFAVNGGTVDNKGAVDFSTGSGHTAIAVDNGHVANTGNIAANGTAIHIKGAASTISNSGTITAVDGLAAIHVDAGAGLDLGAVSGNGTIVAKGSADGILLDTGATSLNVANTLIDMSDASATGIGIHNVAGISGIRLDNTTINLGGSGIGV